MKKLLVLTLVVVVSISLFVGCLSLNNEPILSLNNPKGQSVKCQQPLNIAIDPVKSQLFRAEGTIEK